MHFCYKLILVFLVFSFSSICGCGKEEEWNDSDEIDTPEDGKKSLNLSADFSKKIESWNIKPGSCFSTVYGQTEMSTQAFDFLNKLDFKIVRLWLRFNDVYDVKTKQPQYAKRQEYVQRWDQLSDTLLLNWRTNYELCEGEHPVFTYDELFNATVKTISYYKKLAPSLSLIEIENEMTSNTMVENYTRYKFMYKVINKVNSLNLIGGPIRIGGPVTSALSDYFFKKWLECYKKDTDPSKHIDFIAYHEYVFKDKDNIAVISNSRDRVDALLKNYGGITKLLPIYITETGIFQTDKNTGLGIDVDYHVQAAGMATMFYYLYNQKQIYPFHWTLYHPDNSRKNLFVDYKNAGVPRPYGLLLQLQSMMPVNRYSSDVFFDNHGIGVGSLAAADDKSFAIMAWNYQYDRVDEKNTEVVELKFNNLPKNLLDRKLKMIQYLIPNDKHEGNLTINKAEEIQVDENGTYSTSVKLRPNELQMTILTIK